MIVAVVFSGKRLDVDGVRFVLSTDDINCEHASEGVTVTWQPPGELASSIQLLATYLLDCKEELRVHAMVDKCTIVVESLAWSAQQEIVINKSIASALFESGVNLVIRPFT